LNRISDPDSVGVSGSLPGAIRMSSWCADTTRDAVSGHIVLLMTAQKWSVRRLEPQDQERWRELYAGYTDFYEVDQTEEMADRVWQWLHDPGQQSEGIVAVGEDGVIQGIAHFRDFARPLTATTGGFLDDIFVDPGQRGGGAADALFAELRRIGERRGWSVVRWITADDNYRARGKYDQLATRTGWITYDMVP
jgi:GNAT superfamily N-acetyltransferase